MEKRVYRVIADVEVVVDPDVTDEHVDKFLRRYSNYEEIKDEPRYREQGDFNEHLLQALVSNEEVLDRLLRKWVLNEVLENGSRANPVSREEDEVILEPVFKQLPPDSAEYFREGIENGLFVEYSEYLYEQVKTEIVKLMISSRTHGT